MKPQGLEMAGLRKDGKEAIKSKTRENRNLIFLTLSLEGGGYQLLRQEHYPPACEWAIPRKAAADIDELIETLNSTSKFTL